MKQIVEEFAKYSPTYILFLLFFEFSQSTKEEVYSLGLYLVESFELFNFAAVLDIQKRH